jgi:uncharacterized protein (DUF1684 family)
MNPAETPTWLDLYSWRRQVARMWQAREQALQAGEAAEIVWQRFCSQKDALFRDHPQTPLSAEGRRRFAGLTYFPYDPRLQVEAVLSPAPPEADPDPPVAPRGAMPLRPAARLDFTLDGTPRRLTVFWIDVYGGGLFLPFRDTTGAEETYGGGRYLFDTAKGSDFLALDSGPETAPGGSTPGGYAGGRVLLDFNYAYNPSCAYDPRWVCPLAPRENWLPVPVRAGERRYSTPGS